MVPGVVPAATARFLDKLQETEECEEEAEALQAGKGEHKGIASCLENFDLLTTAPSRARPSTRYPDRNPRQRQRMSVEPYDRSPLHLNSWQGG